MIPDMACRDAADNKQVPLGSTNELAIELAARWIVRGRRLDMQGLADELGCSRVTLFRNIGTREQLLAEALWLLTEKMLQLATRRWEAERREGELYSIGTGRHINMLVSRSSALHNLLVQEPALTIKVLTDPKGRVQTGVVAFVEATLRRDMVDHGYVPIAGPADLAFALVRLGESFLYADVLAARQPDADAANRIQQVLLEGVRTMVDTTHTPARPDPDQPPLIAPPKGPHHGF